MAKATCRRHRSTNRATQHRRTPSGKRAVIRQSLGKCHGDASANRSSNSDEESLPCVMRGERRRKKRRQGRNRAVHQPSEARLYILQHEQAPRSRVLALARRLGQNGFTELMGEALVFVFRIRKFVQQLSYRRIMCRLRGLVIVDVSCADCAAL